MYTARDVSLRLRRELDDERLGVKFDRLQERWMVYVRRKMLTGARRWPVTVLDDGTVFEGGTTTLRAVDFLDDIVWVVEVDGQYHSLDPNLIRQKLVERDSHRRNVAKELFAELARRKASKQKAFLDDAYQRSLHYRKQFARIADDMGLAGRPDYSRIYRPRPFVAEV